MPRSGWIAVGATIAALAVPSIAPDRVATAALPLIVVSVLLAWAVPRGRTAILGLALGAGLISIRLLAGPVPPTATEPPVGDGPWTMGVESVGSPRDGDQVATLRQAGPASDGTFRAMATLPRYPAIRPGDVVEVDGRLRRRPDSPFGAYLERIGAWGTLDADRLVVMSGGGGPGAWLEDLRRDAGDALAAVLPEPEAGLAAGILIGLRDRVDRGVAEAFTTAGVSHVVAISGWNIAIVAAAVAAVAGRLGRRRRTAVTILAITAYIAFAGASPSVLRAGAMAGVVLVARETGRASRAAAALGWAAVGLLVVDPALIGDAGFQLSTLATAGLIAWSSGTTEWIERRSGGRAPRWLAESLGVSLAAQLATLPVVVASFGRLAVIAPAVNLLIVPLVAPVMAAGILAMFGGWLVGLGLPAPLGAVLAVPAWVGLRLMIGIIDPAAGLPWASLAIDPPWDVAIAIGLTGVIGALIVVPRRRSRRRRPSPASVASATERASGRRETPAGRARTRQLATLVVVVAVACLGGVAANRPAGVARLSVLDVGQGDAILVEGSRGARLLVDGGPDPDRLLVELDRRLPPWDRRIDVVILSHPHEDHVAGLGLLLARYRVSRVLEPGMRGASPGYDGWLAALDGASAPVHGIIAAGDRLAVDDVALEVRWPIPGTVPSEPSDSGTGINNVSVVLLGSIGRHRFLLAGDVEEEVDPSLVAAGLPTVDILKVAHHGSRTATTDAFLATVRPRVAIASAGADNPYGHPARATIDRLAATGARVYRTDVDGTVSVTFEPGGPVVRRSPRRGAALRPVRAVATVPSSDLAARRAFLCAIPGFGTPVAAPVPARARGVTALAAAGPSPDPDRPDAADRRAGGLRYHRHDAHPDPLRQRSPGCVPASGAALGGRAAAVHLGRRRPARRADGRPVRVRARDRARHAARAMGRPP